MSSLAALALVVALFLVPAWLARGAGDSRVAVVRNAAIARALPVAAVGPLVAYGATGEVWPALIAASFVGLGAWLAVLVLRSVGSIVGDAPTTLHAFVAQRHGGDARVRAFAAALTIVAVAGMLAVEALAVTVWLRRVLHWPAGATHAAVFALVAAAALPAIGAGRAGVLAAAQWQLGILQLALFGTAVVLLYLHVSALAPLTPHGALALVAFALAGVLLLLLRRSRYVDTHPIGNRDLGDRGDRLASRFAKLLNIAVSVSVVLVLVFVGMEFAAAGGERIASEAAAALSSRSRIDAVALVALMAFPLVRPIVDVASWQQPAVITPSGPERPAFDGALLWLLVAMLGAIAAMASPTPGGTDAIVHAASSGGAAPLLLVLACAIALPSMAALIHGVACTVRGNVPTARTDDGAQEVAASRRARIAAGGVAIVAVAAPALVDVDAAAHRLLPLFFAAGAAGLAVAPLVLSAALSQRTVSGAAALAVLATATSAGAAAAFAYVMTGTEAWLWAVAPACLAAGASTLAVARTFASVNQRSRAR